MSHSCHAFGCGIAVPPSMMFCRPHWYLLPKPVRDAVWNEYRPGQERDKIPSARYMAVQRYAIALVAFKPSDEAAAALSARMLVRAEEWRARAIAEGKGDPLATLLPSVGVPA